MVVSSEKTFITGAKQLYLKPESAQILLVTSYLGALLIIYFFTFVSICWLRNIHVYSALFHKFHIFVDFYWLRNKGKNKQNIIEFFFLKLLG